MIKNSSADLSVKALVRAMENVGKKHRVQNWLAEYDGPGKYRRMKLGEDRLSFVYNHNQNVNTLAELCELAGINKARINAALERDEKYPTQRAAAFRRQIPWRDIISGVKAFIDARSPELLLAAEDASDQAFDPQDVFDGRRRIYQSIVARRGQKTFRASILRAYAYRCCITDCDTIDVLEAAHIYPYRGSDTNHASNGLLLRTDLHTLYDLYLLSVNPTNHLIEMHPKLINSSYSDLIGRRIRLPDRKSEQPSLKSLENHYLEYSSRLK